MTEYNLFCYSEKYNDKYSFQQGRYIAFNKIVSKDRYYEIRKEVTTILSNNTVVLLNFWEQVTNDQWKRLLAIPEAKDFKVGFEYISGQKIKQEERMVEINGNKWSESSIVEALKKHIN